ncbi:MAG TPA: N-acetyltransferase [Terriglobia bacterium]
MNLEEVHHVQQSLRTPRLRAFRASDLEALYQLDQVCFAPGVAYSKADLESYIRRRDVKIWVAEARGETEAELPGFILVHCDRGKRGHIITIDVAPAWRRRAVGTALMDEAENWVRRRGGEFVLLETAERNLPAQMFYSRRGYLKLTRIEDYYGDGAAAWLMVKPLQDAN